MVLTLESLLTSNRLPTLPQVALRIIELAQQREPDLDEVIRTVRLDPAITAKVLGTANSALFGLRGRVNHIEEAIPKLGLNLLRTIVLSFTLAKHRTQQKFLNDKIQEFWRCSLTQAVFAENLAAKVPQADPSTYFMAGLLQDIGVLGLLSAAPELYCEQVLSRANMPQVAAAEHQVFGLTHVDVTRGLCTRWGIDPNVIDAMGRHHDRFASNSSKVTPLETALQAASLGAQFVQSHLRQQSRVLVELNMLLMENEWDITPVETEELLYESCLRVAEMAAMFAFDIGDSVDADQILERAKYVLEDIAFQSQLEVMQTRQFVVDVQREQSFRQKQLQNQANTDELTGAYNRRFLSDWVNGQAADWIETLQPFGILFLDIDKFKSINDAHGHAIGDQAIRQVAQVLQQTLRKADYVIRYGGDEFVATLAKVTPADVASVSQRVGKRIKELNFDQAKDLKITSSIGALHYTPTGGDPRNAQWLIDQVDQAMYEAKRAGGDRVFQYVVQGKQVLNESLDN
jgi:diguanylate cyclase (GGDEF)-like protein